MVDIAFKVVGHIFIYERGRLLPLKIYFKISEKLSVSFKFNQKEEKWKTSCFLGKSNWQLCLIVTTQTWEFYVSEHVDYLKQSRFSSLITDQFSHFPFPLSEYPIFLISYFVSLIFYPFSLMPPPISLIPYISSNIPHLLSLIPYALSFIPYPLSLIPYPLSLMPYALCLISYLSSLISYL